MNRVGTQPPNVGDRLLPWRGRSGALRGPSALCRPGSPQLVDHAVDRTGSERHGPLVRDAGDLWKACTDTLRVQVSEATWRTWFGGLRPLRIDADTLVLAVPSNLVTGTARRPLSGHGRGRSRRGGRRATRGRAAGQAARSPRGRALPTTVRFLPAGTWRPSRTCPRPAPGRPPPRPRVWQPRPARPAQRHGGPARRGRAHRPSRRGQVVPTGRGHPQPPVHLRRLRHRGVQPLRPRRRPAGGRDAGQLVQPPVHPRRLRAGQDAPAARHRSLRAGELPRRPTSATCPPRRS